MCSLGATTTRLNGERSMRLDVPSDKSSRGVGSNLEVGSKLLLLLPTLLLLLLGRTSSGRNPIPGGLEKIPSSEQGNKKHTHTKKEESYCFVTEHTVQRGRPTGRKHLTLTTLIIFAYFHDALKGTDVYVKRIISGKMTRRHGLRVPFSTLRSLLISTKKKKRAQCRSP